MQGLQKTRRNFKSKHHAVNFIAGIQIHQAGGLMNLYARDKIDRVMFGFEVPASFLQALHAFYVILLGVPVAYFWTRWRKKGRERYSLFKMGIGTIITGLGFLLLAGAAIETASSLDGTT